MEVGRFCGSFTLDGFTGEVYRPDVPLFVAQSYNLILSMALDRQQDIFFMMHSDSEAYNEIVKELLQQAEQLDSDGVPWGVLHTNYDAFCLWNSRRIKEMRWDQYLPLYYTDVDFYYRMRLAGLQIVETSLPVKHAEGGSSAIKNESALNAFVQTSYPAWRNYYVAKCGYSGQETFTTPFGK